ncbi:MAG: hypothetical protein V1871_04405 [Planctomycetota bacterium]
MFIILNISNLPELALGQAGKTKLCLAVIIFFLSILALLPAESKPTSSDPDGTAVEKGSKGETLRDDIYQKSKKIYEAIEKIDSGNITKQQEGFEQLRLMGPMVLPFVSAHLKEKSIFLELVRQIIEDGIFKDGKPSGIFTAPLHNINSLPPETALVEKYFYGKYLQSLKLFDQENYESAKELATAILTIERKLSFSNQLKLLKIQCEEMIIQRGLLKATLIPIPKEGLPSCLYEIGDRIKLTLKLENVSLLPLEIIFGRDNFIMLQVNLNQYDPFGNFNNKVLTEEFPVKINSVKLNPNEKKEFELVLDTLRDNPNSACYRTYTLYTEIRPETIKGETLEKKIGMNETIRKISSPSIMLRIFPPDVKPALNNPIEKLETALQGGIPLDIFLCSLLVPESKQTQAIELLIKALESPPIKTLEEIKMSPEVWDLVIMNSLKHVTNLPFEINKTTWLEWFKRKKK